MKETHKDKLEINLAGVPQTLLMPLLGRAIYSKESYSPIQDFHAVQLVQSLNYNFDHLLPKVRRSIGFWMARAFHFDQAIKNYLKSNPKGTIVNLGAGLDTTYYRVDNGLLTWIDLDLPEVIELRNKFFTPSSRVHAISKSVLDYSWMKEIKQHGDKFLFLAGGFFMYFTEDQVKNIFIEFAKEFPSSELVFDSVATNGISYGNKMLEQANMTDARLQWGIDDLNLISTWSPQIKITNKFPYYKNIKTKYAFPRPQKIKMFLNDLFNKSRIVHLKF